MRRPGTLPIACPLEVAPAIAAHRRRLRFLALPLFTIALAHRSSAQQPAQPPTPQPAQQSIAQPAPAAVPAPQLPEAPASQLPGQAAATGTLTGTILDRATEHPSLEPASPSLATARPPPAAPLPKSQSPPPTDASPSPISLPAHSSSP